MRKFFATLAILLVCYIIIFDLEKGTLPPVKEKAKAVHLEKQPDLPNFKVTVKAGDTVLTIVENRLNKPIPVSIEKVVTDFKILNETTPENIQIGRTYYFPDYSK